MVIQAAALTTLKPRYPLTFEAESQSKTTTEDSVSFGVHSQEDFTLSIPEKRVNGYKWFADLGEADRSALSITKDEFKVSTEPGHVDQIGIHTYGFHLGVASLPLHFQLSLRHTWEPDGPVVEQKQIDLRNA